MVASNLSLKGYHRSLKAFLSLPQGVKSGCVLLLVGADPHIPEYDRQTRAMGLGSHVRFLGGREDVPEILFGSDLLIHPAQREATGNVLLEAAVAGVPVLCSEICGYSFYISQFGLGTVIKEPFVQETLNTALHQMLTNQKQRAVWMSNAGNFQETRKSSVAPSGWSRYLKIFFQRGVPTGLIR